MFDFFLINNSVKKNLEFSMLYYKFKVSFKLIQASNSSKNQVVIVCPLIEMTDGFGFLRDERWI